jgi:hypothetical protein
MLAPTGPLITDQFVGDRRRELMNEAAAHRQARRLQATQHATAATQPRHGRLRCYAARLRARFA